MQFISLKGGCTGSYESSFVKMPHCWKSHVAAQKEREENKKEEVEVEADNEVERDEVEIDD